VLNDVLMIASLCDKILFVCYIQLIKWTVYE